jgi:4-amino-4-deoxy-L-arabinose transferase-like glycosyltransferase
MIYLLPLIFSLPLLYGISNLIGVDHRVYIILAGILAAYFVGAIYKITVGREKRGLDKKNILWSVFFSVTFVLMIFICSKKYEMSFVTFLAMFVGALYYGFIAVGFLTPVLEGASVSAISNLIKDGWRRLLGLKPVDYLGLFPPIIFMVSYLFLENINVFGDEASNLLDLRNVIYWSIQSPNLFYRVKVLYIFSRDYPPLFFLLSTPFLKFFYNWVVGARVYVMLIGILDVGLIYLFLKKHVSIIAALLGSVVLVTSFSFINATRTYGQEIILITFVLIVLILMSRYLETTNRIFLLITGIFIALGMLSKYNYFIYAAVPILYYLGAAHIKKPEIRKVFNDLVLLALPSFLFVSPWYLYTYITNPVTNNVLSRFFYQKSIGRYESNVSLSQALTEIWQQRSAYFSDFVYWILALLAFTFLIIWVIKFIKKENKWDHLGELVWMPLVSILIVSLFLKLIGLILLRWNLSYVFIPILIAYMFDKIFYKNRVIEMIVGVALYSFLVLLFVNVAIHHTPGGDLFRVDVSAQRLLPNPLTTGAKESVAIIKDNWLENNGGLDEPVIVGFIGHINEGLHGHALAYYGAMTGFTNWQESDVGILNGFKPTDLSVFVNTDYLIYIPNNQFNYEQQTAPKVLKRYQWVIENAPVAFRRCTKELGTINSRFGYVVVLKIDRSCLVPETYFDLIDVGRQYDAQQPSFLIFWDVEELRYKLQFNLVSNSQKNQACEQIRNNIVVEKAGFSAFNFSLIQSDLAGICGNP